MSKYMLETVTKIDIWALMMEAVSSSEMSYLTDYMVLTSQMAAI
jgi:hypothetical protein